MVTYQATLVHLLKQSNDQLTSRQTHWAEKMTPYSVLMRILYKKRILNEATPMSRRPDFLSVDNLYRPNESLMCDGNVPGIMYFRNIPALLALSTLESLNVDDEFLTNLKGASFLV